jgi:hypothetical protein
MSSAVSALGSFDPTTLINSLTAPAASSTTAADTNGVSAQQEFSAMAKNGDLNSLLSDSVAVGVMQFSDASSTPSAAVTDIPNMVNQLIAAYTPGQEDSSSSQAQQQSAAMLSTNPALAIIQALETSGAMGSTLADSVANSVMAQAG